MSGDKIKCGFETEVNVQVRDTNLTLSCIVIPRIIEGYQLLLGMDAINKIVCVIVRRGKVFFGNVGRVEARQTRTMEVIDKDFTAHLMEGVGQFLGNGRGRTDQP